MKKIFLLTALILSLLACRKEHVKNDICDCADSQSTVIIGSDTLIIPNLITPNGDGYNDMWRIINIDKFPDCKVKVTRPGLFGGTVFESTGYTQMWDGSNKKEGKYKYEITINGQTYKGFVCIYRGRTLNNYNCINACVKIDAGDPIAN